MCVRVWVSQQTVFVLVCVGPVYECVEPGSERVCAGGYLSSIWEACGAFIGVLAWVGRQVDKWVGGWDAVSGLVCMSVSSGLQYHQESGGFKWTWGLGEQISSTANFLTIFFGVGGVGLSRVPQCSPNLRVADVHWSNTSVLVEYRQGFVLWRYLRAHNRS